MITKWILGTSAVVGVATLALGLMLVFSGSPATESPDDTRELVSALVTDGDGTSEGIQVHGDWTIAVHDPDGTLVERREFKNALTIHGEGLLLWLIAGEYWIDRNEWRIKLRGEPEFTGENMGKRLVKDNKYVGEDFFIENAADKHYAPPPGGAPHYRLTGSTTVSISEPTYAQTVINTVSTLAQARCTEWRIEDTGPCASDEAMVYALTEHTLNDPITIKQDQKVTVEVRIGFDVPNRY